MNNSEARKREQEASLVDGQVIHAVMYRDYKIGTLCDSGAWGTPSLFTAITEQVTCPGCLHKLEGARAPHQATVVEQARAVVAQMIMDGELQALLAKHERAAGR